MFNHQVKEYFEVKARDSRREQKGRDMLDKLVLPHMPRSLEDCFDVSYLSFGKENPIDRLRIDFYRNSGSKMELAYGTIDKVLVGLDIRGGWTITSAPAASLLYSTSKVVQVILEARMEVEEDHSIWDAIQGILRRIPVPTRTVTLVMHFENLSPTDNCRLVPVEVWVEEEPAVAGHMETRNKLVCEENEDEGQ